MTHFSASPKRHSPGKLAWLRRLLALAAFGALAFSLLTAPGLQRAEAGAPKRPMQALATNVVISEFRVVGSAGDSDEFIEIFNPTRNPIDITGWNIARSNNSGTIETVHTFGSVVLDPGQYYLVVSTSYDDILVALGDVTSTLGDLGIANNGGIALRDTTNIIIDQVGMSATPSFVEGNPLSQLSTNVDRGYSRINVCVDKDNNGADFILTTPSRPQNYLSPLTPCILINEVAWGGTQADDTQAQWIELYNPGSTDIDLTGWYLRILNKGDIPLSGTLSAGAYYLIERNQTDTSAAHSILYAFPFLNVNGDSLYLYSNTHNLVDSANSNGGPWPAGNRFVNYQSMERFGQPYGADTDAAWLTFDPLTYPLPFATDRDGNNINGSPGQLNSPGLVSTPTPHPTETPIPTQTFTPSGLRSVIINEVAWMGTLASAEDEWIELYNTRSTSINITGWTITATGSTFSITLAGTIPANGYFLIERSDNNTVSDIAADQIFTTGSLTDTGMALNLRTASNEPIDSANGNGGVWPDGNPTTKCSMERRGSTIADSDTAWITNAGTLKNGKDADGNDICGTPKNINWAYYVTPTPSPVGPTRTPTRTRTPTPIPPAKVSQIILNEFLVHPRSDWNNDGLVDSGDEFIELLNVGNVSVDLQGWRLDDQDGDSSPYTISGVSLAPGARAVFFASQTGLLLSNRSDSVRLFQPNGAISDAFTYTSPTKPDQTWCRLPDGGPTWVFGCEPTLSQINKLAETIFRGERDLPAICESPALPAAVFLTECLPSGLEAWSRRLWDGFLPVTKVFFERHGQEYWIE
jgi:hypothetical protein